MKLYFNENFEIIKREDENVYCGSELYNKLHVYFPQNILKQYLILYPIFSYKRVDNREGSEIGFTQINSDDAEWYEWYDVLPDKALEVKGVLQITITFKLVKNEGDVIAKKTTGKVLLNVKDAIISDTDIIYTDTPEKIIVSMNSKINAVYSAIGDARKLINDIIDGVKIVARAQHAIDADNADVAIYDINGHEIAEFYNEIENIKNTFASINYVVTNFVKNSTYNIAMENINKHMNDVYGYFNGEKAIPKAIADKYGNEINIEEIKNDIYNLDENLTNRLSGIDFNFQIINGDLAEINRKINTINSILTSDDINLDTLQELVNALKNNVSNISDIFIQLGLKANRNEIPTAMSQLLNDSEYMTRDSVLELLNIEFENGEEGAY